MAVAQTFPITPAMLRDACDETYFNRGQRYFREGCIVRLNIKGDTAAAVVRGTQRYRVDLWIEDGQILGECSCPLGDEGAFCKHCIAVALAWIDRANRPAPDPPVGAAASGRPSREARRYERVGAMLRAMNPESLVALVLERAVNDDAWMAALARQALAATAADPAACRDAIHEATRLDSGMTPAEFGAAVRQAHNAIAAMLDRGRADDALALAAYAVQRAARAADRLGRHDRRPNSLHKALDDLASLHHRAVVAARPDPQALAAKLLDIELGDDATLLRETWKTYADFLGDAGLLAYRKLAEERWRKLPRLRGQAWGEFDPARVRLRAILTDLAPPGDLHWRVEVEARDLSSPGRYRHIAGLFEQADRIDDAIEWAQRGLQAFPHAHHADLRTFLTRQFQRQSKHEQAIKLCWDAFEQNPQPYAYLELKGCAEAADAWPRWKKQALEHLRRTPRHASVGRRDRSRVVDALLDEGDAARAWHEAQEGDCADHLWLRLAQTREAEHPIDALAIYQEQIDATVGRTNRHAYEEAIRLLQRIVALMRRLGHAGVPEYLHAIRAQHKAKRNFIKLLDPLIAEAGKTRRG